MKKHGTFGIIAFICCLSAVPALGHDCGRHDHHCGDCCEGYRDSCHGSQADRNSTGVAPSSGVANLQNLDGKISEIDYLPGSTPDTGMVEVRMQSAGQSELISLAPCGFLKLSGLHLKEGDTVTLKGFRVAGMQGDLIVATAIQRGDKSLALRDSHGQPLW